MRLLRQTSATRGAIPLLRNCSHRLSPGPNQKTPELRSLFRRTCALLTVLNVGAWLLALLVLPTTPASLGLMLMVYGLGLRHGVDADHIAAIDNVTRKLMAEGRRPVTVGLYFALGHSAVVLIGTILVACTARTLAPEAGSHRLGIAALGGSISAVFLFLIAIVNIGIFA